MKSVVLFCRAVLCVIGKEARQNKDTVFKSGHCERVSVPAKGVVRVKKSEKSEKLVHEKQCSTDIIEIECYKGQVKQD